MRTFIVLLVVVVSLGLCSAGLAEATQGSMDASAPVELYDDNDRAYGPGDQALCSYSYQEAGGRVVDTSERVQGFAAANLASLEDQCRTVTSNRHAKKGESISTPCHDCKWSVRMSADPLWYGYCWEGDHKWELWARFPSQTACVEEVKRRHHCDDKPKPACDKMN